MHACLLASGQPLRSVIVIEAALSELTSGSSLGGSNVTNHPAPGIISNLLTSSASELLAGQNGSGGWGQCNGASGNGATSGALVALTKTIKTGHAHRGGRVELLLAEEIAVDDKDEQQHNQHSSQHSVSGDNVSEGLKQFGS
jgi:hypothetical protein